MIGPLRLPAALLVASLTQVRPVFAAPQTPDRTGTDEALTAIQINDNRRPAGVLRDGVLRIDLEVGTGVWRPEGEAGVGLVVHAFGERGGGLQIPGPLIRVPAGTWIEATVRNSLVTPVVVHGLATRPGSDQVTHLAPNAVGAFAFAAGAPGTYYFWARLATTPPHQRPAMESQLSGAFIVDATPGPHNDRVFVIGVWNDRGDPAARAAVAERETAVANGRSWPHTERLTYTMGDSVRWRWINASTRSHPMHLSGSFFRVDARGDLDQDTVYAARDRRLVVTEELRPGQTMAVAWQPPGRPGSWLFHCHVSFHTAPWLRVRPDPDGRRGDGEGRVAGLAVGVRVVPVPGAPAPQPPHDPDRSLRLVAQLVPGRYGDHPGVGFVLDGRADVEPVGQIPGPLLVLTRGEPLSVEVVNRLPEPTRVHWHGLVLESYSHGVSGWSGGPEFQAPSIAPGDAISARFTAPRAGTFAYHAPQGDVAQLASGMYGPVVVLEPGERFDPQTDHLFTMGWGGGWRLSGGAPPFVEVNGDTVPRTLEFAHGRTHRLRLINIAPAGEITVRIHAPNRRLALWRPIAKNGATLPPHRAVTGRAVTSMQVGETADFGFTPPAPGDYLMVFDNVIDAPRVAIVLRVRE